MTKEELLKIGIDKRNKIRSESWDELNSKYAHMKNGESFRDFVRHNIKSKDKIIDNTSDNINNKSTIEIKSNGEQISDRLIKMSENDSKNPSFLLKSHGYDPNLFDLISAKNSIWNTQGKEDTINTLYSSKISVKPKDMPMISKEKIDKIFNNLTNKHNKNTYCANNYTYENLNQILVINIADLHYDLKSYIETSNNEYDRQIASNIFLHIIDDVIRRTKNQKFEKILLLNLGDLCNYNMPYATVKGTEQNDHEGSFYSMIDSVCNLLITGIDKLANVAPVEIISINGNHDKYVSYCIFKMIQAYYRNYSQVNVIVNSLDRFYYHYGKVTFGISHDIDEKNAFKIITNEAKEYVSDTDYFYWFVGHLHKTMLIDDYGLEIRRMPTCCGSSEWTYSKGYCGTVKKCDSFIIDKDYGIIDTISTVIK